MASPPILLRITAHNTPHQSDPPNADEFYAAVGRFTVAWGRFEGHFTAAMLQILSLPEAVHLTRAVPISWKKRAKLWRDAFNGVDSLRPLQARALGFIQRVMSEIEDRHLGAHAIWDEFVASAPEPTIRARMISPRRGGPSIIDVIDYEVELWRLKLALVVANNLNIELLEFTNFLSSLRPPPSDIRTL
jgi:hypothetical protein